MKPERWRQIDQILEAQSPKMAWLRTIPGLGWCHS